MLQRRRRPERPWGVVGVSCEACRNLESRATHNPSLPQHAASRRRVCVARSDRPLGATLSTAPRAKTPSRMQATSFPHFDPEATPRLWSVACLGALVMASALYSTPSVPSEASDQRSGPGVAAPLAPVDATLEPSNPPPPPVLQVRRHSQRRDVWRTSHASPPVLPWMRPAALVALAHRHWSPLPSPPAAMRTRRRSSSSNLCWCAPHLATCHPFFCWHCPKRAHTRAPVWQVDVDTESAGAEHPLTAPQPTHMRPIMR